MTIKTDTPHFHGHRARLRERFLKNGIESFADYEVLELFLTIGIARKDVKPIAKELLNTFQTLSGVLNASIEDLMNVKGVGENAAMSLKIAKAVAQAYRWDTAHKKKSVSSKIELLNYLYARMEGLKHEEFHAIYLDAKNNILHAECLFRGSLTVSAVYPREVMVAALKHGAAGLVVVHNHPSGETEPSVNDEIITVELFAAAQALGITLHDHIIVGNKQHYSFADHGKL